MVLKVPLEDLPETMSQLGIAGPVFVAGLGGRSLVSVAHPEQSFVIHADSADVVDKVKSWLAEKGLTALNGCWSPDGAEMMLPASSFWITAIAYRSHDDKPGLWVDAQAFKSSAGEALSKMFEEFRASGELDGMTIEDFIERCDPNVIILDPGEQAHFAAEAPCP
jgi:hypothetical protein